MANSTLTSKGQTTIPLEIREALGLRPGMRLIFEVAAPPSSGSHGGFLRHFRTRPSAHWVDCFLAAASEESALPVASFDRDFDDLTGSTRVAPALL